MIVPPAIIDTHAHLASTKLAADLDQVLQRAAEAGVFQIVSIGTTAEDAHHTLEIAPPISKRVRGRWYSSQ